MIATKRRSGKEGRTERKRERENVERGVIRRSQT